MYELAADLRCHYCRVPFALTASGATRDHIVPASIGGRLDSWNIVKACGLCNNRKADNLTDCPCGLCERAVRAFTAYVAYLETFDPATAEKMQRKFNALQTRTLVDIIGAPRALVLEQMARNVAT